MSSSPQRRVLIDYFIIKYCPVYTTSDLGIDSQAVNDVYQAAVLIPDQIMTGAKKSHKNLWIIKFKTAHETFWLIREVFNYKFSTLGYDMSTSGPAVHGYC